MSDHDEPAGWIGDERSDGMTVSRATMPSHIGTWVVKPSDHRPVLRLCPCCNLPFKTSRAAKLACNEYYPLKAPS